MSGPTERDRRAATFEALRRRFGQQPRLAALLRSYVARYPGIVEELRESRGARDLARIRTITHKLTGSAGSFGYPDVSDCARRCGQLAASGAPLPEIETELDTLEALMLAVVASLPANLPASGTD